MKWISNFARMAILLSFVSCAKDVSEIFGAPKTQDQAGLIASCTTKAQAIEVAHKTGAKFRVINEKRKIVEFLNIDAKELKENLPHIKLRENIVYDEPLVASDNFGAQSYTGDYPFYGAHSPVYRTESSGRYFKHLGQIDALVPTNGAQGEGVTIAIVDTGVYYNHPHLSPNILTNPNDQHGSLENNFDDDNNGYNDDYVGYDFYNNDPYPMDDNGHGTHVAGLAAGTYGGVAPKAKILSIKVLGADGRGDLATVAQGILYALDRGVDIVNLSLGGPASSTASRDLQALLNSVEVARQNDSLIIAAAGNGGSDGIGDCNDSEPIYPANIQNGAVISVAAVDSYNNITNYSNFGVETVHVAAPGGDMYTGQLTSTGIPSCYGQCSQSQQVYTGSMGTSMATPIVSGIVALVKSANINLSNIQIKEIVMNNGVDVKSLTDKVQSAKVINAAMAVQAAN
jgi:subtilisin family serine protease